MLAINKKSLVDVLYDLLEEHNLKFPIFLHWTMESFEPITWVVNAMWLITQESQENYDMTTLTGIYKNDTITAETSIIKLNICMDFLFDTL